jgi:Ser/Thr protein kinase RdoA (MazF antagonist)
LTIGDKIAQGREAEVYAWGEEAVLKLYRPGYYGYEAESAALARLDGVGVAPGLIGAVEVEGRHGLVLERLAGLDMLAVLERQPWRLLALARVFAEAHIRIHRVSAPDLPDLKQVVALRIREGVARRALRDFALRLLDDLPSGGRLCHGDLHPGNALVAGGSANVIDWANAARGVPEADHARTMLLLERADPLPGTPLLFRGLMAAGRTAFARAYARTYRKGSPDPLRHVDPWLTVHAAARLSEGIAAEERMLIAMLERARRSQ